jgi:hypothetical protein
MDDPRPVGIIPASSTERQQLSYECLRAIARTRMNRQAGRLVHDEQVRILEHHRDGRRLRLDTLRSCRELDLDHRSCLETVALRPGNAVDEDRALLQQALGDGT